MLSLQNDRSLVIKPVNKGSAVVVWDRTNYLKEAKSELSDEKLTEILELQKKSS